MHREQRSELLSLCGIKAVMGNYLVVKVCSLYYKERSLCVQKLQEKRNG